MKIYEDDRFLIENCASCPLPGYLILKVKDGCKSIGHLDAETAGRLGLMLSMATKAIQDAIKPERVYCLAFGEGSPEVHFHLFPRTRWLLEAYQKATHTEKDAIDGPRLFQWARTHLGSGMETLMPDMDATTFVRQAKQ
jgi:diadenosine tetraphosphate (Ap4A) HIT family hydrolase